MADLAVVGQDPRFGDGAWAQTAAFLDGARDLGRSPELLYLRHPGLASRPLPARAPADGIAAAGRFDALNQALAGRRLRRRVREARSAWVIATAASFGVAAARSGRPYGCWIGTSLAEEWRGRRPGLRASRRLALAANAPVLARLEREVLRGAARVHATSAASRAALAEAAGLDLERIGVLPIPIDVERFAPEDDETWAARLDAPTLVFVGRADDPRKNLDLLLQAFAELRRRLPRARLRLVGEPPRAHVGEGVEVAGRVDSVPGALRDASLLVLPSRQEGFGIVAAEALASGVPVLTTPCGGPEELVRSSRGGVVLEDWDAGSMAEGAAELLGDAANLVAMRRRGRDYVVERHSRRPFLERLEAALAEVDQAT